MNESPTQQRVRLAAAQTGLMLWRNNSGAAYDETGRLIRYGLGNDSAQINKRIQSSDLIGITPVLITPAMVGTVVGLFTAFECKHSEWKPNKKLDERETAQQAFIDVVRQYGGYAGFTTGPDDVKRILGI